MIRDLYSNGYSPDGYDPDAEIENETDAESLPIVYCIICHEWDEECTCGRTTDEYDFPF